MTAKELSDSVMTRLAAVYGEREARAMTRILFEHYKGWSPVDVIMHAGEELLPVTVSAVDKAVVRVAAGEPIQYVVGSARFYGMDFRVTPDTLIPRPETAELVDLIVDRWKSRSDLQVLDCGTGSGCIAIALARNLPFSDVTGIDISAGALAVARGNSTELKARVNFQIADMLALDAADGRRYDIIVSNPPYIAEHEKTAMNVNVLEHEPHRALFVPDDDPLRFYTAVARYAAVALKPRGVLYFEINPLYVNEMLAMLGSCGFNNNEVINDSQGRRRFTVSSL